MTSTRPMVFNCTMNRVQLGASFIEPHSVILSSIQHLDSDNELASMFSVSHFMRKLTRVNYPSWADTSKPHYLLVPEHDVQKWLAASKPATAKIITAHWSLQTKIVINIHGE